MTVLSSCIPDKFLCRRNAVETRGVEGRRSVGEGTGRRMGMLIAHKSVVCSVKDITIIIGKIQRLSVPS